ncbi:PucR family transcriptional regulator [Domibacillus enclensis]|uniref:PucR family transcriptional regulator n=1 Tax=Domibacillus enclensis TaxID=1017273 RepID=A0A1N7B9X0_9BACI|nr:PucR family transcriptional regulator [Domibacillus enclensis]OXS74644.1 PucR family transcriptional regulator [Domibacillus enclensis]SIR48087.1 transcriptional regulator, PucR family [Domibacillus enclensis]
MKLKTLLAQEPFHQMKLIAGEKGLANDITNVTMMDAPDILPYLKPNDLLVTTGYHVKDDPTALIQLIEQMARKSCAALFIKTKRFFGEIPADSLQLANSLHFPIVEIPENWSLGETVNQMLSVILDKRTSELRGAIDTHKLFSSHIMSGKGLNALLANLTDLTGHRAFLCTAYFSPIAGDRALADVLSPFKKWSSEHGSFLSPGSAFTAFSTMAQKEDYTLFPVYTHEKKAALLLLEGPIYPTEHVKLLTIEQAVNVISFELLKEDAVKQFTRRIRNEFFSNFLDDAFSSEEEAVSRAKEFDLPLKQKYICAAGRIDAPEEEWSYYTNQKELDAIYYFFEKELHTMEVPCHLFTKGETLILLLKVPEHIKDTHSFTASFLQTLQSRLSREHGATMSFGISHLCSSLLFVRQGYKEARDAWKTNRLSSGPSSVHFHRTKDVSELLRLLPVKDLTQFYKHTVQQLKLSNLEEEKSLLDTLFVYMESHCHISETAKRLFVHRNTVVYRLEKCEELLGTSLKDPEFSLQIRLALRIKHLMNT